MLRFKDPSGARRRVLRGTEARSRETGVTDCGQQGCVWGAKTGREA